MSNHEDMNNVNQEDSIVKDFPEDYASDDRDRERDADADGGKKNFGGEVDIDDWKGVKDDEGREVCKDFLRNVCSRGNKCKYFHPQEIVQSRVRNDYQFCHDYQNRGCYRENCRYIHCPREDEDTYKQTGKVSEMLARGILQSGQGTTDDVAGIPVCKDFLTSRCDRGRNKCRYWHIDPHAPPLLGRVSQPMGPGGGGGPPPMQRGMPPGPPMPQPWMSGAPMPGGGGGLPYHMRGSGMPGGGGGIKRPRMDENGGGHHHHHPGHHMVGGGGGGRAPPYEASNARAGMNALQEENLVMKQKLDMMKKQVSDLTAANEVLLEQNARLRAKLEVSSGQAGGLGGGNPNDMGPGPVPPPSVHNQSAYGTPYG